MNKKNIIIGSIIAVLAILLITSFLWNRDVRNKLRIAQHNVEAALDSIRYLKDANGNLYAEKKSFIATISELKELNTEMYENIQSLQKKLQKKVQQKAQKKPPPPQKRSANTSSATRQ